MEAQAFGSVQSRNAASAQIRFDGADRLRHGEEPRAASAIPMVPAVVADSTAGSGSGCGRLRKRGPPRQRREVDQAAAFADDVEQIAMFAGGGVGPFAGRALAGSAPERTNIERPGVLRTSPTSQ
jgi:hypothetical protein